MGKDQLDDEDRDMDRDRELGADMMEQVREILDDVVQATDVTPDEVVVEERIGFDKVRYFMTEMFAHFRTRWKTSTRLVIDESMFGWGGVTDAQLIAMLRKPIPLGFCIRTLCDEPSGILLNGDFVEGTAGDLKKEFSDEYKPHTAVTLRVTKPYHHKNKILVGDAYFGSLSTAMALAMYGTFCVMNVKLASSGFPKQALKSAVNERGKVAHKKLAFPGPDAPTNMPYIFGSAHCDIQPMVLIHTCGTSTPGKPRTRQWRGMVDGKILHKKYTLE